MGFYWQSWKSLKAHCWQLGQGGDRDYVQTVEFFKLAHFQPANHGWVPGRGCLFAVSSPWEQPKQLESPENHSCLHRAQEMSKGLQGGKKVSNQNTFYFYFSHCNTKAECLPEIVFWRTRCSDCIMRWLTWVIKEEETDVLDQRTMSKRKGKISPN